MDFYEIGDKAELLSRYGGDPRRLKGYCPTCMRT